MANTPYPANLRLFDSEANGAVAGAVRFFDLFCRFPILKATLSKCRVNR